MWQTDRQSSKGNNSKSINERVMVLDSTRCLMFIDIHMKFHEDSLNRFSSYRVDMILWQTDALVKNNTSPNPKVGTMKCQTLFSGKNNKNNKNILQCLLNFFFFFLIWVLWPFQEYFTYIEPIVHQNWAKTGEPWEKPPRPHVTRVRLEPQWWKT